MPRWPEPVSLLPLVQHQKPLTPCGTTEQAESRSCAFLLWTSKFPSSLPGFFFNFLSQVPCIEARVWPYRCKTEEDFINKCPLLGIYLSRDPSQFSEELQNFPPLHGMGQSTLMMAILFYSTSWSYPPASILLVHSFLKSSQAAENANSLGDIKCPSSI